MELKIPKARAELKNMNLRTENNGDEKVLATDLKFSINTTALSVAALFKDAPKLLDSLYDEGGNVLCEEVMLTYIVPTENVELTIDKLKPLKGGRIKKNVTVRPRQGKRVELVLTVQFTEPTHIEPIAKRLHDEVSIKIIEKQQSLDLKGNGDDEANVA